MATLLDALSQENLDNQREVVKNEKRQSYDNRPYGSFYEKLQGHLFPAEHPYHHTPIGSMDDLDAASLEDVSAFFRTWYAPNNAVLSIVGDVDDGPRPRGRRALLRSHPGQPGHPAARRPVAPADARRASAARPCSTRCRCRASTSGSGRRSSATPRLDALEVAGQILAGGKGSRLNRRLVRDERIAQDVALFTLGFIGGGVGHGGLGDGPAGGRRSARVEAALIEELERLTTELVSDDELARAKALIEADELGALQRVEELADRLSMYATLFDDPGLINRMLPRYLAVTPEAIRAVARGRLPRRTIGSS